jgi:hypothetical protein
MTRTLQEMQGTHFFQAMTPHKQIVVPPLETNTVVVPHRCAPLLSCHDDDRNSGEGRKKSSKMTQLFGRLAILSAK